MSSESTAENSRDNNLGLLEVSLTKSTLEEWKETAAECARNDLFNKKQFLVNDKELDMGGTVQKLIANKLNMTDEKRMIIFWSEGGGRETVRNAFRKKRQAAQNAMKLAFRGETNESS